MKVDRSIIGTKGGRARLVVERSAVEAFARAVKDDDPIYRDAQAAEAAGFATIPAPPTYLIAAAHHGSFAELQPDDPGDDPVKAAIRAFLTDGGMVLHGEQTFTFERPVLVGDTLDLEHEIVDVYDKGSMTFVVAETRYTEAATGNLVATSRSNYIRR